MSARRGSRRRFLAAACLLPVAWRVRATHELQLALATQRWGHELGLEALLDLLEATGITGVELGHGGAHGVSIELGPEARELARRRFEERTLTLVGLASDVQLLAAGDRAAHARAWLELAHDLGAGGVRISVAVASGEERAAWIARAVASLHPLAERAAELELELRIDVPSEPERWSALLDDLDHPCVVAAPSIATRVPTGLVARLGRSVRVRELTEGESALEETLEALARDGSVRWCLFDPDADAPPDLTAALAERRVRFDKLLSHDDR